MYAGHHTATLTAAASLGRGQARSSEAIVPFRINVPNAVLVDLKERLARTRFPSEIEGSGWDYGTNLAYLKELVTYWRTKFDWREQERRLNQLPQFKTTHRRRRDSFRPSALEPCRRDAARVRPRLAGIVFRSARRSSDR